MGLAGAAIAGGAISAVGSIAAGSMSSSAAKKAAQTQADASKDATATTLRAAQDAIARMEGYSGSALSILAPFFSGRAGPLTLAGLPGLSTGTTSGAPANTNGGSASNPTGDQLQAIAKARPDLFSAFQKDGSGDFGQWLQNWYARQSPGGDQSSTNDGAITAYDKSTNTPTFGGFVDSLSGTAAGAGAGAGSYADPTAAITSAYQSLLGRPPTAAEMQKATADYTTGFASGKPLNVQSAITSSPEYQAALAAGKIGPDGGFNKAPGFAGLTDLANGSASSPVVSNLQSLADLSAGAYGPLKGILAGTDPSQLNLASFANGTAPSQSTVKDIVQGTSPALATEQAVFSGNAPTLRSLSELANGNSTLTAGLWPAQIAGSQATGQLSRYLTDPGSYQTSPGYQFERDEGLKAITNAASATGAGGNTQQAAAKYAEGLAGQDYFNTLTSLQSLAGLGTNAASTAASLGAGAATSLGGIGQSAAANLTGAQTGAAGDILANETAAATSRANIGASAAGQLTSTAAGAQGDLASIIANALSQLYGGSLSSSQSAAGLLGNLGSAVGSTAVGAGNSVSNNIIGAGNANAAGQIGSANAVAGGINSATGGISNALLMYQLLGKAA